MLAFDEYEYSITQIIPEFSLMCSGLTPTEDVHYIVEYGTNVNVGERSGSITIRGINNCAGTVTAYFNITQRSLNQSDVVVEFSPTSYTYTGEAITVENLVVKDKGILLVPGTDYDVSYMNNVDSGINTAILILTGTYGGNYREDVPKTIYFSILPKTLDSSIFLSIDNTDVWSQSVKTVTYRGSEYIVTEMVKANGVTVDNQNYDLRITRNNTVNSDWTNAGTIIFTATGKGNYTGTSYGTFVIAPLNLTNSTAEFSQIPAPNRRRGQPQRPTAFAGICGRRRNGGQLRFLPGQPHSD